MTGFADCVVGDTDRTVVYVGAWGEVPDGEAVGDYCGEPSCVNPDHLILVKAPTQRALNEVCRYGHEYTEENTYWWGTKRQCIKCRLRLAREYKARRRARKAAQEAVAA